MATKKKPVPQSKPSFDPQTLEATSTQARALVDGAGQRAVELVEAWVASKNVSAILAIANDETGLPQARKAAKRGLSVLKARGMTIEEPARIARLVADEAPTVEAWMFAPEAGGSMLIVIGSHTPTSRYRLAQIVVQPGIGVLQVQSSELNGSQLRSWFDDLEKRFGYRTAQVPLDWARARVAQARAAQTKSGLIPPMGIDSLRDLIEPAPEHTPPHPIDAATLEVPEAERTIASSALLHGEPEFRAWMPPNPAIQALLTYLGEALGRHGTPEAPPEKEKFDQVMSNALDELTDRFFSPELRQQLAATMKDAAISVLARAGKERAATVLSVANAVVAAGLVTQPPHEIPFLRAFFQKAIAVLAAQNNGQISIPVRAPQPQEPEAGSIITPAELAGSIVTPEEAALDASPPGAAAPGEKVSPGGIILP